MLHLIWCKNNFLKKVSLAEPNLSIKTQTLTMRQAFYKKFILTFHNNDTIFKINMFCYILVTRLSSKGYI